VIELYPELAPKAVERIRLLTRRGFYDGLLFHRVIAGFVAQTGNPNNKDGGKSELPNLPLEANQRVYPHNPDTRLRTSVYPAGTFDFGFIGALPVVTVSTRGGPVTTGIYCTGVVGMGHDDADDTANSELFIMLAPATRLNGKYTAVGRVLGGFDVVAGLPVGEPPAKPDSMKRVRVLADLPLAERPRIELMDTRSSAFRDKAQVGASAEPLTYNACAVDVPVRTAP
ncbi:MAG: peptidylprolyl isomerase, partial [Asticcacaulis sp.]